MTKPSINRPGRLLLTCEHGGVSLPAALKGQIKKELPHLRSDPDDHRQWDPGALEVTRFLSQTLNAPYFANTYSRALIDCNRSDNNPQRFPPQIRRLSPALKTRLEAEIMRPYKSSVREFVRRSLRSGVPVTLISVHSFNPVMKGKVRPTDLGVLYRPWRADEVFLAESIKAHVDAFSRLKVHRNLPYRGHTDCFLNELLREHPQKISGIMIELNCGLIHDKSKWNELKWALAYAINATL